MGSNSQNDKFYKSDFDLGPMTLVLKLDLDMVKMSHHTKNEFSMSRHSKVFACTDTQTDRHTDTQIPGADPGGAPGAWAPRPPKLRPQHQNSTKLRPQNGSFRPVTIWPPPLIKSWIRPWIHRQYENITFPHTRAVIIQFSPIHINLGELIRKSVIS